MLGTSVMKRKDPRRARPQGERVGARWSVLTKVARAWRSGEIVTPVDIYECSSEGPPMRILSLLVVLLPLLVVRQAAAQMHICAGKPCPGTDARSGSDGAAPRAVVIDAVVLMPALERLNPRVGIERGVLAALRDKGWDAVTATTDCKDLGCAGAAAAGAKATYAVVLTGRFVKDETYADEVAVLLWRDGAVVATRTEVEEEMDFVRNDGARTEFGRCGPPSGICTTKLLGAKLRDYAATLASNEMVAINVRKKVAATSAAETPPALPPAAPAMPAPAAMPPPALVSASPSVASDRRWIGWTLVGVGVVAGVGSAVAWSRNNDLFDCGGAAAGDPAACRQKRGTVVPAASLGVAAAGALVGGILILIGDHSERQAVALSVQPSGFSVGGRF